MRILDQPDVAKYPDYPKVALSATSTEIKTLLYELKGCMNQDSKILHLESQTTASTEIVRNENIELVPRLPI